MFKPLILSLGLVLPMVALAADNKPAPASVTASQPAGPVRAAAKPAKVNDLAAAQSAEAAASAADPRTKRQRQERQLNENHQRGADMGKCQQLAADKALSGVERRQFLAQCVTASRAASANP